MLLHWATDGRNQAFADLLKAKEQGLCKSVGVSNFMPEHLEPLIAETGARPSVNQIELHPYLQQRDVTDFCRAHHLAVQAWSPLMQGAFLQEPLFAEIGEQVGKTAAQVVLRWSVQHGNIVLPKSKTPSRVVENGALFDFELSDEQMKAMDALERGQRFGPDPRNFSF